MGLNFARKVVDHEEAQLHRPADVPDRDRLETGERGDDGAHAGLALREPDGGCDVPDDLPRFSQRLGGCR